MALGALWGSSFLFMRFSAVEFGAMATAAGRVGIAAAFLLPIVVIKGLLPELKKHWKKIFFMGIFNSAIPYACHVFFGKAGGYAVAQAGQQASQHGPAG